MDLIIYIFILCTQLDSYIYSFIVKLILMYNQFIGPYIKEKRYKIIKLYIDIMNPYFFSSRPYLLFTLSSSSFFLSTSTLLKALFAWKKAEQLGNHNYNILMRLNNVRCMFDGCPVTLSSSFWDHFPSILAIWNKSL